MKKISLIDFLKAWDEIEKGNPDQAFSIKFITKDGELRYYNRAVKSGTPFSLKDNQMRACIPVDDEGKKLQNSHSTPFSIYRIVDFNGKTILL